MLLSNSESNSTGGKNNNFRGRPVQVVEPIKALEPVPVPELRDKDPDLRDKDPKKLRPDASTFQVPETSGTRGTNAEFHQHGNEEFASISSSSQYDRNSNQSINVTTNNALWTSPVDLRMPFGLPEASGDQLSADYNSETTVTSLFGGANGHGSVKRRTLEHVQNTRSHYRARRSRGGIHNGIHNFISGRGQTKTDIDYLPKTRSHRARRSDYSPNTKLADQPKSHDQALLDEYLKLSITNRKQNHLKTMMDERIGTALLIGVTASYRETSKFLYLKSYASKRINPSQLLKHENHAENQIKQDHEDGGGQYQYFKKAVYEKFQLCNSDHHVEDVNLFIFINNSSCGDCVPIDRDLIEIVSELESKNPQLNFNVFIGYGKQCMYHKPGRDSDNAAASRAAFEAFMNLTKIKIPRVKVTIDKITENSLAEREFHAAVLEWLKMPDNYNGNSDTLVTSKRELLCNIFQFMEPSEYQRILHQYTQKETIEIKFRKQMNKSIDDIITDEDFDKMDPWEKINILRLR
ncbi:uncharacterized protein [Amphiura filiformis]|uniref:uncharacterized protein n=1 Tax=Amphiura filiformis TaxID=82378 RepID=UPI003B20CD2A